MPAGLVCPNCRAAYTHKTGSYKLPQACAHCGALLLLRPTPVLHLVLVCRRCREVFESLFGQFVPGTLHRCPQCGSPLGGAAA
jgi:rRNA maturation endonuclease Nob1